MESSERQEPLIQSGSSEQQECPGQPGSPTPQQAPEPHTEPGGAKTSGRIDRLRRAARTALIMVGIALGVATALAYAGVQPFATCKDMVQQSLVTIDDLPIPRLSEEYPRTRRFTGTYSTSIPALGLQQTLTFKSDTLTLVDEYAGTLVYRYTATMESESEGVLELVDVNGGEPSLVPLHYVSEADCLVLYAQGRDKEGVTYCR